MVLCSIFSMSINPFSCETLPPLINGSYFVILLNHVSRRRSQTAKAADCKSAISRFESGRRLFSFLYDFTEQRITDPLYAERDHFFDGQILHNYLTFLEMPLILVALFPGRSAPVPVMLLGEWPPVVRQAGAGLALKYVRLISIGQLPLFCFRKRLF